MGEFKPKLQPVTPSPVTKPIPLTILLIKSLLAQRKRVFAIAAAQLLICTLFPGRYAIVPIATLLLCMGVTETISMFLPRLPKPPSYMTDVVEGRTTALLPRPDGTFGSSSPSLVVFNLGVQFNHPRGRMCPYGKEIAEKFVEMNNELLERREELGLISISTWTGSQPDTANNLLIKYYFKDVESIHRFAHEEMHRRAWDWYNDVKPQHIGIFHETFVVPARSYETIYANCTPTLLGSGLLKCDDLEGEDRWRNTLVSADTMQLKSQWQRLNRDGSGMPKDSST